ncbi:oligosaccharide flippase family protein [Arcicella sp. LKC2W]|uniref:oligosaccharide flippase family protein n=1 Tax=Arcicella sp. LKC2W TaxID=2984198 RepID=UPI002B1FFC16|nr:oligosaccharide flippase family protein [Arcicella sp. LKC2W]MEA5461287.1 oligosaccharide flippase family protein [Arcicella sp. LKC2W]
MIKPSISKNMLFAIIQFLVFLLGNFFLYRYINLKLGVEQLGVWSIVTSVSSLISAGLINFNASIVPLIADAKTKKDNVTFDNLIFTGFSMSFIVSLPMIILIYFILKYGLIYFVNEDNLYQESIVLMPFILLSIWISNISSIIIGFIEGLNYTFVRSIILIIGFLVFVIFNFFLLPKYGIVGAAYAQIIQFLLICFLGLLFLFKKINLYSILISNKVCLTTIKKILLPSMNYQMSSLVMLFFDPVTKLALSKFGGISTVGYYEMANKLAMQLRNPFLSILQVTIPIFASFNAKLFIAEQVKLYKILFRFSFLGYSFAAMALITLLPSVSKFLIGEVNTEFIFICITLIIGWLFNSCVNPAYYYNIAVQKISLNTFCHIIMALSNLILCFVIGTIDGNFTILAPSFSLIISTLFLLYKHEGSFYKIMLLFNLKDFIVVFMIVVESLFMLYLIKYKLNETKYIFFCVTVFGIILVTGFKIYMREFISIFYSIRKIDK